MTEKTYLENQIPDVRGPKVALDIELFSAKRRRLHRETGTFACLSVCDGSTVWLITAPALLSPTIQAVLPYTWIMHNAAFDLFHLRRWTAIPRRTPENLWDTMLWERLLWNGFYQDFALEDLARRYLDLYVDKSARKEFEKSEGWPDLLKKSVKKQEDFIAPAKKYSALDAWITYWSQQRQEGELEKREKRADLKRIWTEIDGPMIELVLEFKGFCLDEAAWRSLADSNAAIRDSFKTSLPYNPASPAQVLGELKKHKAGVSDTQAQTLQDYLEMTVSRPADAARQICKDVLSFREAAKLAGTYGHKMLDNFLEPDGRIYAHYWITGASTGRTASADPNLQNIPTDPRFRSCFVAADDCLLAIADYKQQETRILAHISGDPNLRDTFLRGGDPHLEITRRIFRDPRITHDDPRRKQGKAISLGIPYGLTSYGLAKASGISKDRAEVLIQAYFREYPQVESYMKHYRWLGQTNEFVQTPYGRITWMDLYSAQWPNHAINAPVQGGAADQLKLALRLLWQKCQERGWKFPVVGMVHDEIIAEFPKGIIQDGAALIREVMLEAGRIMFPTVPWEVDITIGSNWAAKK